MGITLSSTNRENAVSHVLWPIPGAIQICSPGSSGLYTTGKDPRWKAQQPSPVNLPSGNRSSSHAYDAVVQVNAVNPRYKLFPILSEMGGMNMYIIPRLGDVEVYCWVYHANRIVMVQSQEYRRSLIECFNMFHIAWQLVELLSTMVCCSPRWINTLPAKERRKTVIWPIMGINIISQLWVLHQFSTGRASVKAVSTSGWSISPYFQATWVEATKTLVVISRCRGMSSD